MLQEFKNFINKGNVMDLAVAVIMGAAFGAIVTALVEKILMPIIGIFLGGVDFSGLAITVGAANIGYGAFIQAVVNFLIIAFVVFMIVRTINRPQKEVAPAAPAPTVEEQLLTEIRDLMKAAR